MHGTHNTGENHPMFGKHLSAKHRARMSVSLKIAMNKPETRAKMRAANSGEKNPMFGKHHSEEVRAKISTITSNKLKSAETRAKMNAAKKGKHWFNNGVENIFCYECPYGFVSGMLMNKHVK